MKTSVVVALFLATVSIAEAAPRTFQALVADIIAVIDLTIPVIISLAMLWYLWNIASTLRSDKGTVDSQKMRVYAGWGLAILFMMVSIWGILRLLNSTITSHSSGTSGVGAEVCGGLDECIE